MTQENKDLLLKDLCARLPYGVKVKQAGWEHVLESVNMHDISFDSSCAIPKPYLRPMSSMTEEEKKELCELAEVEAIGIDDRWGSCLSWNTGTSDDYADVSFEIDAIAKTSAWLDEKKFDWRRVKVNGKYVSFIKAGLALEAPADMYR